MLLALISTVTTVVLEEQINSQIFLLSKLTSSIGVLSSRFNEVGKYFSFLTLQCIVVHSYTSRDFLVFSWILLRPVLLQTFGKGCSKTVWLPCDSGFSYHMAAIFHVPETDISSCVVRGFFALIVYYNTIKCYKVTSMLTSLVFQGERCTELVCCYLPMHCDLGLPSYQSTHQANSA